MDIDQLWGEANAALTQSSNTEQIKRAMISESNSHVAQLTTRLAQQRNWAMGFLVAFVIAAVLWRHSSVALSCLAVMIVLYVIGAYVLHKGVLDLRAFAKTSGPTRSRIEAELAIIKRTLRTNTIWSVIAVPLMIVLSMAMSYAVKQGLDFEALFQDPKFLRGTLVSLVVLGPLAALLGTYLTRVAFGRMTDQLEANLEALRRIETVG